MPQVKLEGTTCLIREWNSSKGPTLDGDNGDQDEKYKQ
jgi:hypothetical protein